MDFWQVVSNQNCKFDRQLCLNTHLIINNVVIDSQINCNGGFIDWGIQILWTQNINHEHINIKIEELC